MKRAFVINYQKFCVFGCNWQRSFTLGISCFLSSKCFLSSTAQRECHLDVEIRCHLLVTRDFSALAVCFSLCSASPSLGCHILSASICFCMLFYCPRFSSLRIVLEWCFAGGMVLLPGVLSGMAPRWAWSWLRTEPKSMHSFISKWLHFTLHLDLRTGNSLFNHLRSILW